MTTQIVVGGRPIAYEPDIADGNVRTHVCSWHKADMSGSGFLRRKLIVAPYFAGRKSLM